MKRIHLTRWLLAGWLAFGLSLGLAAQADLTPGNEAQGGAAQRETASGPEIGVPDSSSPGKPDKLDIQLRFWQGDGPAAGSTVTTSTTLKHFFDGRIVSEREEEKEGVELQRAFRMESIVLLHQAVLSWDTSAGKLSTDVISVGPEQYRVDLTSWALDGTYRFRIFITGTGAQAEKATVFDSEVVLTQEQPVVIGFRGTPEGKERYFLSLRLLRISSETMSSAGHAIRVAGIHRPKQIKQVAPQYPAKALKEKIAGVVVIEASTDIYGRVRALRVLRGHPELNEAALMAVKQWVYEPYIVDGQPQPVVFTVTVCFSLDKDKDRGDKDVKSVPPSPAARILANKPPVRVAGTHRPKKIKDAVPIYPAKALKEKIAGVVVVEASTDIYGRVRALRVISGHPELDQAALDAVKQWVYEPYRIDGKPMPVVFTVTVCFSLNKDEKK